MKAKMVTRNLMTPLLIIWAILLSSCGTLNYLEAKNYPNFHEISTGKSVAEWGFDPQDSTQYLQTALNSPDPVIVIPAQPGPWYTKPLNIPSNKTVLFEPGAVLLAKPGAFQDKGDCLLRLRGSEKVRIVGYGAKMAMKKMDYRRYPYPRSEWRHAIEMRGAREVLIEGLEVEGSGGDGIYVGNLDDSALGGCSDITIRNVALRNNYRQGISVISVDGLLIEGCIIEGTEGTAPAAGIDFEPNLEHESITDCIVRSCTIQGNSGPGILVYLRPFTTKSTEVDIRIESSIIRGNTVNIAVFGMDSNPRGNLRIHKSFVPWPHFVARGKNFELTWSD